MNRAIALLIGLTLTTFSLGVVLGQMADPLTASDAPKKPPKKTVSKKTKKKTTQPPAMVLSNDDLPAGHRYYNGQRTPIPATPPNTPVILPVGQSFQAPVPGQTPAPTPPSPAPPTVTPVSPPASTPPAAPSKN